MTEVSILQWNVQGMTRKKDEILEIISNYTIDIVAIQETKTKDVERFKFPQFNSIYHDLP